MLNKQQTITITTTTIIAIIVVTSSSDTWLGSLAKLFGILTLLVNTITLMRSRKK